jgi:hypothetical protein
VNADGVALPVFKERNVSKVSKSGNKVDSKLKGDKKVILYRFLFIYI